ncbi:MAG: hypothetical protein RXR16_03590 [Thermocladium sp.]
MKWVTHFGGALLLTGGFYFAGFPLSLGLITGFLLGSILPDLMDIMMGAPRIVPHRNIFSHNALLGAGILSLFALYPYTSLLGLGIGVLHHDALDVITRGGIYIGSKRVHGKLLALNPIHNALILVLQGLIALYIVYIVKPYLF